MREEGDDWTGDPWSVDESAGSLSPTSQTMGTPTASRAKRRNWMFVLIPVLMVAIGGGALMAYGATRKESVDFGQMPSWARPGSVVYPDSEVYRARVLRVIPAATSGGEPQLELARLDESGQPQTASEVLGLAYIRPFALARCGSEAESADALAALVVAAPVGAQFLVITDGRGEGFLHSISSGSKLPSTAPPLDSLNEHLVTTGSWEPDSDSVSYPYDTSKAKEQTQFSMSAQLSEGVADPYRERILEAANVALDSTPTGQQCSAAYEAFVEEQAAEEARVAARIERLRQKAQDTLGGQSGSSDGTVYGGTICGPGDRDGDGDGICNEW